MVLFIRILSAIGTDYSNATINPHSNQPNPNQSPPKTTLQVERLLSTQTPFSFYALATQ